MAEKITPRAKDYPQWYLDIVKEAGLADNSDVRGCMVIKPTGYAIWEKMYHYLLDFEELLDPQALGMGKGRIYLPGPNLLLDAGYWAFVAERTIDSPPELRQALASSWQGLLADARRAHLFA